MDHLSSTPRLFPSGDCEVAIDNDQVVKKNWKVRVGQKNRVSIITSVCQAVVDGSDDLQKRPDLSPRNWRRTFVDEDFGALEEAINFDPYKNESLRKENKQLLQKCLEQVFKEQNARGDGGCTDDIDEKVKEIEKKKTTRICPNCHTEMPPKRESVSIPIAE
ncbi:uncharacterized protein LOC116602974 [Nematostella vectensis]|uniref:uncharacterized protein LOC116602974 n=1 Tax=Nematostella vectensis TaxID=45351 RepID=UPI00138FDB76|nr:uncharacterized protein LOC116602974 [Nematostella vectensis]